MKPPKLITDLQIIAERKRRAVEHLERAIARWYARNGVTDLVPRFKRGEVGRDE